MIYSPKGELFLYFLSPTFIDQYYQMNDAIHVITPREKEVMHLLAKGMTYNKMAGQLCVTSETVKKHLKNIYRKLRVQNKIEALQKVKLL